MRSSLSQSGLRGVAPNVVDKLYLPVMWALAADRPCRALVDDCSGTDPEEAGRSRASVPGGRPDAGRASTMITVRNLTAGHLPAVICWCSRVLISSSASRCAREQRAGTWTLDQASSVLVPGPSGLASDSRLHVAGLPLLHDLMPPPLVRWASTSVLSPTELLPFRWDDQDSPDQDRQELWRVERGKERSGQVRCP